MKMAGMKRNATRKAVVGAVVVTGLGLLALAAWNHFGRDGEPTRFADVLEEFKYGSIGAEVNGLPYPIWRVMPALCPDKLPPGGYAGLGFLSEPGHELPVGISVRKYLVPRAGFNCATCHTARVNGGALILGAPAVTLDVAAYIRFTVDCGTSPAFTAANVLAAFERAGLDLPFYDRLAYRLIIVGVVRGRLEEQKASLAWMFARPAHGPGRTDALGGWKQRLGHSWADDHTVPTVDMPSIWNQKLRAGMWLHWDGDNSSLDERNLSAAMAGGATPASLDHTSIQRVARWLQDLPPPRYPFAIDAALAARGGAIYRAEGCPICHDVGADKGVVGEVTKLAEIGTDPDRLIGFTERLARDFLTVGAGYEWQFKNYRKSDGYANSPLDGIWARAPYLHNGSVPTLWDLLSPAGQRPPRFGRGCDRFDESKVGHRCEGPFSFDTTLAGNGNQGHAYGTSLDDDARRALVEYLKTL
jgi:mono/diheme cytochrome c family protein